MQHMLKQVIFARMCDIYQTPVTLAENSLIESITYRAIALWFFWFGRPQEFEDVSYSLPKTIYFTVMEPC